MAATAFSDPEPAALVQRFSWEVEARQGTGTREYDQLGCDLLAETNRRAKERERDIRRIEEQFNAMR